MSERRLASVQQIKKLEPIPDADQIVKLTVGGWPVVSQKDNNWAVNDFCVFFEIDSFIDVTDSRFEFLAERGLKTNSAGEQGHVLRTIRLKKTYSQGLILPLKLFPEITPDLIFEGSDVTELLKIEKWEPPIPAQLSGSVEGSFPTFFMKKTDAERVQNLGSIFPLEVTAAIATEKIDGTSASYGLDSTGKFWVCSRNLALKETEGNLYWKIARELEIEEFLRSFSDEFREQAVVLQGEIFGEGIQNNPLGVKGQKFSAFNLQFGYNTVNSAVLGMDHQTIPGIQVPIYKDLELPDSPDEAIEQVEGIKSLISPQRQAEGIVWWLYGHEYRNFKAINNKFLLKEK